MYSDLQTFDEICDEIIDLAIMCEKAACSQRIGMVEKYCTDLVEVTERLREAPRELHFE